MSETLYHMSVHLVWALRLPDHELRGLLFDARSRSGLDARQARHLLVSKLREGFDVLPVCDHYDDTGRCLGHPVERTP
jgi:hypothetical protein